MNNNELRCFFYYNEFVDISFFFRSLASEWGKYGMRFNCIQPGIIETKVTLNLVFFCNFYVRTTLLLLVKVWT